MLIKEICKKCINNRVKSDYGKWNEGDERRWDMGLVFCGSDNLSIFSSVSKINRGNLGGIDISEIPSFCLYPTEHLVLGE